MGPRPRGRGINGNSLAAGVPAVLQWGRDRRKPRSRQRLQWGRDRAVAEFVFQSIRLSLSIRFNGAATARSRNLGRIAQLSGSDSASMGRPRGRGIVPRSREGEADIKASMGPRPRGRGIPTSRWPPSGAGKSFNGAATARSRNFEWLLFGWRRADKLQWGRDRAVAELTMDAWDHGAVPRFNGAATARSRNYRTIQRRSGLLRASMGPRPRGRGIARERVGRLALIPGFNGAATARSRNSASDSSTSHMKRGFNGAATARSRNCGTDIHGGGAALASMGPRPRGRGISPLRQSSANGTGLQWGRDRAVAELAQSPVTDGVGVGASMGPRPRGRGIGLAYGACALQSSLQWGRDRAVAELCGQTERLYRVAGRFNGAATARSRN